MSSHPSKALLPPPQVQDRAEVNRAKRLLRRAVKARSLPDLMEVFFLTQVVPPPDRLGLEQGLIAQVILGQWEEGLRWLATRNELPWEGPLASYPSLDRDPPAVAAMNHGSPGMLGILVAAGRHTIQDRGWNLLAVAARRGHRSAVETVLACGADVEALTPVVLDTPDGIANSNALGNAACADIALLLLAAGADPTRSLGRQRFGLDGFPDWLIERSLTDPAQAQALVQGWRHQAHAAGQSDPLEAIGFEWLSNPSVGKVSLLQWAFDPALGMEFQSEDFPPRRYGDFQRARFAFQKVLVAAGMDWAAPSPAGVSWSAWARESGYPELREQLEKAALLRALPSDSTNIRRGGRF